MERKRKVTARGMRVNTWVIFDRAVEEGVNIGWNRALKYADELISEISEDKLERLKELICSNMEREITNSVCEVFEFDENTEK